MKFKIGDLVTISEANYYKYFERFENIISQDEIDFFGLMNQKLIIDKIILTKEGTMYILLIDGEQIHFSFLEEEIISYKEIK